MADSNTVQQAINELMRLKRSEIDDCERAIRNEDLIRARREICDADSKLGRIISLLQSA